MSALHAYSWVAFAVFMVALIPCWVATYQPIEHVYGWVIGGRTLLGNTFAIPILGTLKAAAIALCWPVVVPVMGALWLRERR